VAESPSYFDSCNNAPKSGKAREVPISPELEGVLRELVATRHRREGFADPDYVFLSPKGLPML
jgi:hypothetical protein